MHTKPKENFHCSFGSSKNVSQQNKMDFQIVERKVPEKLYSKNDGEVREAKPLEQNSLHEVQEVLYALALGRRNVGAGGDLGVGVADVAAGDFEVLGGAQALHCINFTSQSIGLSREVYLSSAKSFVF